jgi:hypothetical protein
VHRESSPSALPAFGDVSNIAYSDDPTATGWTMNVANDRSIDYFSLHKSNIETATQDLKSEAQGHFPAGRTLLEVLSTKGLICSCPTDVVPRPLKLREMKEEGVEIRLGKLSTLIKRELGRGAFGVVALLETRQETCEIAIKAQRPAGCLAWEYQIMRTIDKRISSRVDLSSSRAFAGALSFVSLADGAILGMQAASSSGLNLIDLVNLHKLRLDQTVPEILALHYTCRMLCHLEVLHWHAKVLVRGS